MGFDDLDTAGLLMSRSDERETAFAAVASMLWQEREVLERVLYRVTCEQLILLGGHVRWLPSADNEVRNAVALLKDCEVLRAVEVNELAQRLGVSGTTSLRELAVLAPEPWGTLLTDHRESLLALTAEIGALTAENRRMLEAGAAAAGESLSRSASSTVTYTAGGQTAPGAPSGPFLLDRQV